MATRRAERKERREEGQGVYSISVTAAVFHIDTFPLNDGAMKNMPLYAGRQACAVQGCNTQDGRGTDKGNEKVQQVRLRDREGDKESGMKGKEGGGPGSVRHVGDGGCVPHGHISVERRCPIKHGTAGRASDLLAMQRCNPNRCL